MKAEGILRARYQHEFDEILDGLYAEAGMTRRKRLSAEERLALKHQKQREKAAATLAEMREKYPDLFEGSPYDETGEQAEILSA